MAENLIDVPQMKSISQVDEESCLICPSKVIGLEQSDLETVHSDHFSCSVPQEHLLLDENEQSSEKIEDVIKHDQEHGESKTIPVHQERSVLQSVDGNAGSLGSVEEGTKHNRGFSESKNLFGSGVRQYGWKINVIDDTAVIETVVGGVGEENFAGFACYLKKSSWNQMKKQEKCGKNVNSWRKLRKGTSNGSSTVFLDEQAKERTSVHFGSRNCSRANENRKVLTRNLDGHKNYRIKNKEGRSSSNMEEQVKNMKTNKVYCVWRKCSRTNSNEKSFTHKLEDQKLFEKRGKGSERVHYIENSRADSNENDCGNKAYRSKMVYTRSEMEAMRFSELAEQKKTWAEIYYCGLTPEVMREYSGLVATIWKKHIHVNYIPKLPILVKRTTEPSQEVAVN